MKHFVISRLWRRTIIMAIIYSLYLVIGTSVFIALESGNVMKAVNDTADFATMKRMFGALRERNFTKKVIMHAFMTHEKAEASEIALEHGHGFIVNYARTVFFALTMMTTIGYGNVSPKTPVGKVVSIIYAFLGVPLHLVLMRFLAGKLESQLEELSEGAQTRWPNCKLAKPLAASCYHASMTIIFLGLPPFVFMYTEQWSFLEGLYYSLITLTTVGLGDYVAGDSLLNRPYYSAYMILVLVWIVFGLAYLCVAFGVIYDMMRRVLFDTSRCFQLKSDVMENSDHYDHVHREDEEQRRTHLYNELMSLTEDDEILDEHLAKLDYLIAEIDEKTRSEIALLERRRNFLISRGENLGRATTSGN